MALHDSDALTDRRFNDGYHELAHVIERLDNVTEMVDMFIDRILPHQESLDGMWFEMERRTMGLHIKRARALFRAHRAFAAEAPEDDENPCDLVEVTEHIRAVKTSCEKLFESADQASNGDIYTPWVSAGNQLDILSGAEETADEALEVAFNIAPDF